MQYLKKLTRKSHKLLEQLNNRYAELKNILHAFSIKEKQRIITWKYVIYTQMTCLLITA